MLHLTVKYTRQEIGLGVDKTSSLGHTRDSPARNSLKCTHHIQLYIYYVCAKNEPAFPDEFYCHCGIYVAYYSKICSTNCQ